MEEISNSHPYNNQPLLRSDPSLEDPFVERTPKTSKTEKSNSFLPKFRNNVESSEKKDKKQMASFKEIFYFADKKDWILVILAVVFAIGNGVAIIYYANPLQDLINAFKYAKEGDKIIEATLHSVYGFLKNSVIVFFNCWFMTAAWAITVERQVNRLRFQYFRILLQKKISFYDRNNALEVASEMQSFVSKIYSSLLTDFTAVINKLSMGICGIAFAFFVGYKMALVMASFLPVMMISGCIRGHFTKKMQLYLQTEKNAIDAGVTETFQLIRTVKMFSAEKHEINRYKEQLKYEFDQNWGFGLKGSLAFTFFFFCIVCNYALGFWTGTYLITERAINENTGKVYQIGEIIIIFFTIYISSLNLSGLPDALANLNVSRYAMKSVLKNFEPSHNDHENSFSQSIRKNEFFEEENEQKYGNKRIHKIDEIVLKNIDFGYDDKILFENLNLQIKKGFTIFIGESGCGKTTVLSLLLRFYDLWKGSIEFVQEDPQSEETKTIDLREISNENLREIIGYVGQEPVLIGDTFREVLLAEDKNDREVMEILEDFNLGKLCNERGLDSKFGAVSGGQKQRLAIARAILKKPKILILDESTSALDHKSEKAVLQSIKNYGIEFIVMVAHRRETLIYSDWIVEFGKGKVLEQGTLKDLIERNVIEPINTETSENQEKRKKEKTEEKEKEKEEEKKENQMKKEEENFAEKYKNLKFKFSYILDQISFNIGNNKSLVLLYILGIIGAIYFGCIFPIFSYLISKIIFILQNIEQADEKTLPIYEKQAQFLANLLFGVCFGSLIFTTLRWICFQYLNEHTGYVTKLSAFKILISRPFSKIQKDNPLHYSFMVTRTCEDLKPISGNYFPTFLENLITLVVGLGIAFYFNWKITCIFLLILPLILLSSKAMMSFNHGLQSTTHDLHMRNHSLVVISLTNLKTVRSNNLEKKILQKYSELLDLSLWKCVKHSNISGMLFGFGQTMISLTFALIFFIGALLIKNNMATPENIYTSIFAVMFAGVQAGGNLHFISSMGKSMLGLSIFMQLIREDKENSLFSENSLESGEEVINDQNETIEKINKNKGEKEKEMYGVSFSHVGFWYDNNVKVLDDFSLRVQGGEKIAIVGESGSGKTTIVHLLLGLYGAEKGEISIIKMPINKSTNENPSLEYEEVKVCEGKPVEGVGVVMQEPEIFNRTIYENIVYNMKGVTVEDIMEICNETWGKFILGEDQQNDSSSSSIQKEEDIREYLNKSVGPYGSLLSIGQKQRVSIVRALLRRPKILILDEATSALDPENEKAVQKTIESLNMTQIIVAHRISTIVNCDRIIVLNNGRIVEEGTFKELVEKKEGYFANMTIANLNQNENEDEKEREKELKKENEYL